MKKYFTLILICFFILAFSIKEPERKIFQAKFHDFFTFKKFHQPSEFDCEKEIVNQLILKIKESKSKKVIFYICTAFPSGKKNGQKYTDSYLKNFKNCFSKKLELKETEIVYKAMGINHPYYIEKDTTIENVSFKKDEILTIEKYKSINKIASNYFNERMTRLEVFVKYKYLYQRIFI